MQFLEQSPVYSHTKNIQLRHYLKAKSASDLKKSTHTHTVNVEQLMTGQSDLVEVFDVNKMRAILNEHERRSNLNRNHQRYISYLGDTEGFMPLAKLPNDILSALDALIMQFPNFIDVIDYYREQIALARLSEPAIFAANPVLIVGPPGIGKTAFCQALAKLVTRHFSLISLSGLTAGFVIGGMSSNWADGKPGRVVEALARGHWANPLIVLDECDKAGGDHRYDPLGALYQLLEKETSANFVDEGLEIPVDCSHIVWMATANELDLIADPIVSRFAVIDVNRPTAQQMENVLMSIYQKIRRSHVWGSQFDEELSPSVICKIIESGLDPRLIQRELISACGKSVLRNLETKSIGKRLNEITPADFSYRQIGRREVRMGFV